MKRHRFFKIAVFLSAIIVSYSYVPDAALARGGGRCGQQDRIKALRDFELEKKARIEKAVVSGKVENGVRVIEMKASKLALEPGTIVANQGEKIRLMLTATNDANSLRICDFKVDFTINPAIVNEVEFVADKNGIFEIFIIVDRLFWHSLLCAELIVK
jgi:heme/copper-type cytochrome/quinol oxidase subunit 2